jgi:hypothetical protein
MKAKHTAGIVLLIAVALLVWWRWPRAESAKQASTSEEVASSTVHADDIPAAPELEWIDGGRPSAEAIASARRKADAVRARLAAQRATGAANYPTQRTTGAANYPSMPTPIGSGTQKGLPLGDYLDDVIQREFMPMGATCYADLVRKQPDAGGGVILDVAIAGDPSVGGVVDSVDVDAGATLAQNDFITCVRESMMAMTFKAPPGGRVTFTLPLEFSP